MKDLTKYYIDLSKCTEEQRKSLPQILVKNRQEYTPAFNDNLSASDIVHFHNTWKIWALSVGIPDDKTELTHPEFIKLFEGEDDNNGWIKIESEADLPKEAGVVYHSAWFENGKMTNYDVRKLYDLSYQFKTFNSINIYQPITKPKPPKF